LTAAAGLKLTFPLVCLVTDRQVVPETQLADQAAEAAAGGVNLVQLREKDLPTRELLALAVELRLALEPLGVPLVVNGRADVAFASGAAGVHLPADGLLVSGARAALGDAYIVGRSVHSADEARQTAAEAADYLVLGTIFPSRSHVDGPTLGTEGVRAAAGGRIPLIAIGGITPENARSVIAAGADGVAVISAILGSRDPRSAAQELNQAVNEAWSSKAIAAHR